METSYYCHILENLTSTKEVVWTVFCVFKIFELQPYLASQMIRIDKALKLKQHTNVKIENSADTSRLPRCKMYGGPKVSGQFQFHHGNFNFVHGNFNFVHGNFNFITAISTSFTAISTSSRQFQFHHGNFNFVHGNFNFVTAISISPRQFQLRSRQFQFYHGNFNFVHANFNFITEIFL